MHILDCGLMEYNQALVLQERLAAGIAAGAEEETLLLLEHPAVYTIGRGGDPAHILDPLLRVERVNRGGDVTWHGPGQLVGYPLVHLGRRGRDLHRWLRFLEEVLIATLAAFGIKGQRIPGKTGVWSSRGKIGFIGVGVRRWVTLHGFALNLCLDLRVYERINPCGMAGCPVSSMGFEAQSPPSMGDVKRTITNLFPQLLTEHLPRAAHPAPPFASLLVSKATSLQ